MSKLSWLGLVFLFFFYPLQSVKCHVDVRVLLLDDFTGTFSVVLESDGGFRLFDPELDSSKTVPEKSLKLQVQKGRIFVNGRRLRNRDIQIEPVAGDTRLGENCYQGIFRLVVRKERAYLINRLDVEAYLKSVLRWESWPGWPVEVNRALAVACRTYVINKVLKARRRTESLWDIGSTQAHQVYKGIDAQSERLVQPIADTAGVVLVDSQNKVIEALYCACCGGCTPAWISGVHFNKARYLKRQYACKFCLKTIDALWQVTKSLAIFKPLLGRKKHLTVTDLRVGRDKAGFIRRLQIKTADGVWHTIKAASLIKQIPDIRSLNCAVTVSTARGVVTFKGRGRGHGLGLCQWGAFGMAVEGYSWEEILAFYYPKTALAPVEVLPS
ncbi:MAG: SpoIID/LytB domain-containing protein [Candidatus Babeliaceae bacterium]|nr:SpoIID/LytB domain-containing protein [Candidatus Babeliaceae bacterium]